MYFVVFGTDRPGTEQLRLDTRPSHQQHLRAHPHPVTVLHGGPTLTADGARMNGSMLVVEADSLADVEAFVADDPYSKAGLFATVEIRPWKWGMGAPGS
ncbi:YciI family protein [Marinibaculum pumilum]|uniref:YciI family protein n=1 Tax=Marinibaculum pumilum TaxID=1766165 RepID=A0ABV7KYG7_9PROT